MKEMLQVKLDEHIFYGTIKELTISPK
jgi:hypothetical protein